MGLLSWLFPSDADKLARAKAQLAKGQYGDARLIAMELEGQEATEVVAAAESALCEVNLQHAVSWAEAGDPNRVQLHLDLAAEFRGPQHDAAFAEARRKIRAVSEAAQAEVAKAKAAEDARLAEISPGWAANAEPELEVPDDIDPDVEDALKARLAILLDNYPEHLQANMLKLGAPFSRAVLQLEDGDPDGALQTLLALPDDDPLVLHERARAARLLGDPAAAARTWQAFAEHAGGHQEIGLHHTAVLLAGVLAESGDLAGARATLEAARKTDPSLGAPLYAQLLEAAGELGPAEQIWRQLLKTHGTQAPIYVGIARVRAKGGKRMEAMQALETSLAQTECVPGRCGYRPPDLATHRMLATLYLEDGIETPRAIELAEVARGLVQRPMWEDVYLEALVARAEGRADEEHALTGKLYEVTPEADPRHAKLVEHLPAA